MLALARRHQPAMAEKLGGDRVEFKKGYIQDLALSVDALEAKLKETPVHGVEQTILRAMQSATCRRIARVANAA